MAFTAYRLWRRIPPHHRRRIVREARKHGSRAARKVANRTRKR
jgi:hypothetical protein